MVMRRRTMRRRPRRLVADTGAFAGDGRSGEALVALCLFGAIAFSPLVLDVFDPPPDLLAAPAATVFVFGLPILYLYLFLAWAVLIGLLAVVVERGALGEAPPPPSEPGSEVE
jgi:hypothetical protein